jgi:hypothetical protein
MQDEAQNAIDPTVGPTQPQIPEASEATSVAAAEAPANAQMATTSTQTPTPSTPPPPFCGYPVERDGQWVPCGKEATDGCAYCDEHGTQEEDDPPPSSYADLQANVEGKTPPAEIQQDKTTPKTAAVPPSTTHHAACGVVGETGDHGDLGSNAIDYVGPLRPETVKG